MEPVAAKQILDAIKRGTPIIVKLVPQIGERNPMAIGFYDKYTMRNGVYELDLDGEKDGGALVAINYQTSYTFDDIVEVGKLRRTKPVFRY